jgi:hypothetical protein
VVVPLGAISQLTMGYYPKAQAKLWRSVFLLAAYIGFIPPETRQFFVDWKGEEHSLSASVCGGLLHKGSIFLFAIG